MPNLDPLGHLTYKLLGANVKSFPFPHFFATDCFPTDFYDSVQAKLPPDDSYSSGASAYKGRKFADPASCSAFSFMETEEFVHAAIQPFLPWMQKRFPDGKLNPHTDLRLILDGENYAIGPHTDAPWKVLSYLFYLPADHSLSELGTSIYLPKDRTFRCPGGPHHKFDLFDRIFTAPFIPNSCFAFFKTNYSFHGVEPIQIQCRRNVLLWNLYDRDMRA